MVKKELRRRDFMKTLLAGVPALSLDWGSFPRGQESSEKAKNEWDSIIIGAGLGGLSCAAAFARQGFKPLVLDQHYVPGGYATTFKRPGGFVFDVSLHSTTVGERNAVYNLIPGFPEIKDVEFVPHHNLYRIIFPEHDIKVPQKDINGYIRMLIEQFPEEKQEIESLFKDMQGLRADINRYSQAGDQVNMASFPKEFPYLFKAFNKTWGQFLDLYTKNVKLRSIISGLWGYYGLPPSKLSCFYYVLPTISYLQEGGYYPIGKSQKISDAFMMFIEDKGGKVLLRRQVEKILVRDHSAYGVRTDDGKEYLGKVVVSNANAYDTFHKMLDEKEFLEKYVAKMDTFSTSLSSFQVFLGLKTDLVNKIGIKDTEIFYETGYDTEAAYADALNAEVEKSGFGLTLYDNLYPGYSPEGKNTMNIIVLQGYDHWKPFEQDYFQGEKTAYNKEKERMADILINKVEKTLLPGLKDAIEVKEIGTPLTNVYYTKNYRGAIYGWDQTLDNSTPRRLPHKTPIKNLFLTGAWTNPGGGYGACIPSGLECFGEIMQEWKKES